MAIHLRHAIKTCPALHRVIAPAAIGAREGRALSFADRMTSLKPHRPNDPQHPSPHDLAVNVAFLADFDLYRRRKLTQKVRNRRITRVDGKIPLGDTAWFMATG
ncbi:MAG: hypothetical protein WAZ48_16785 [Lysobacteraceae bacterium]